MRGVLVILLAACKASDPCASVKGACIDLTVSSTSMLSADELRVTASGAAAGTQTSMVMSARELPVDLPVVLPPSAGGALELVVEALRGMMVVGQGQIDLTVTAGAHSRAAIAIVAGGSDGGVDLGGVLESACADAAHARCQRLASCSPTPPTMMTRRWGDQATCEARTKLDCLLEAGAPDTGFDSGSLEACAAAWSSQSCADHFAGFVPQPCSVPGGRANGVVCYYDSQCQSGFCQLLPDHSCGVCSPATTAGLSTCMDQPGCSGTQACVLGVCQELGGVNSPCSSPKPCAEELSCFNGACVRAGSSVGAACDSNAATAPVCDLDVGLFCTTGGSCAIAAVATSPSPACGLVGGVRTVCVDGADCLRGSCVPPAADGERCDLMNGPFCRAPARCVGNLCHLPDLMSCK